MAEPAPATLETVPAEPAEAPAVTGSHSPHLLLLFLLLATVAAVLGGNGNLAIALAPTLLALLVAAIWFLPLRVTLLVLLAASWAIEAPGDVFASGLLQTPWSMAGKLLWSKLNLVVPVSALVLTGFDFIALLLFAAIIHRHVKRSTLDRVGWVDTPAPISTFALLSVAAVLWISLYGLARGGSFRFLLWQSIKWLYIPIVYALMRQALRGAQDAALVGRVLLGVGAFKAVEAIGLRFMFPSVELMAHATSHHDSVLFGTCVAILAALVLEMPGRRPLRAFLLLVPLYLWGMVANHRRLVWTELALVALFFWLITPWRPVKRKLARLAVLGALPLLLYAIAGWNSQSRLFRPVQTVRSMVDSSRDASALWRDVENFDLVYTYSLNPALGTGFGHPMVDKIHLPDVTAAYELEPYVPHNSVLGLWAFGGFFGFALLWMVFPVGMFFTVRAYRWARTPLERVTALGASAAQICYLMQGYGDLGFGTWGSVFTVAAGYALVGKICIANGGWPRTASEQAVAQPEAPAAWAPSAVPLPASARGSPVVPPP
jgi:hypothetical protein